MLRDLLKEGGLYTIASFITKGLSLLLLPFYTAYFVASDYGIIEMMTVFGGVFNAIASFSLYQGVSRYLGEPSLAQAKKIKIASTAIIFVTISYIIFCFSIILFDDFFINILSSDVVIDKTTFTLAIISVSVNGIFYSLGIQMRFLRKVSLFAMASFLHAILNILLTIYLVLYLERGINGIYEASIYITPLIIIIQLWALRKNLKFQFGFSELKKLFVFSYPLIPAAIAYLVLNFTDRIFIKEQLSYEAVGQYGVASKFSLVISIIILGFGSALTPILYNNHDQENTKTQLRRLFYAFFSIGTIGVLSLSIFSLETLIIFTQQPYYAAYVIMPLLYISMLITGLNLFSSGLHIKEKTKILGVIVFFSAATNVLLNYLLIPHFQLIGAALATLISILINNSTVYYFSNRNYDLKINFTKIFLALPFFVASLIVGNYFIQYWFEQYWIICALKILLIVTYTLVLIKLNVFEKDWQEKIKTKLKIKRRIVLTATLTLTIMLSLSAIFIYNNESGRNTIHEFLKVFDFNITKYDKGQNIELKTLDIKLDEDAYQIISSSRDSAVATGYLKDEYKTEVKAKLNWLNDTLKCKLRLKGDYPDHWSGDKWSFRINIKGNKSFNGMDKFSIQDPNTRKGIKEWYYFQLLKHEDLIALRYEFIQVKINGTDRGIFALEESFGKELLENNGRREAPILKFDESLWIEQILHKDEAELSQEEIYSIAEVGVFRTKKTLKDSVLNQSYQKGKSLLEGLRAGEIELENVIEIKKAAMLYAICDLTGAYHGMRWHNQRFYFNPIIGKLELIGFDSGSGIPIDDILYNHWTNKTLSDEHGLQAWKNIFFSNQNFVYEYLKALEKISSEDYLRSFDKKINYQLNEQLSILYSENAFYEFEHYHYLNNAKIIREKLSKIDIESFTSTRQNINLLIDSNQIEISNGIITLHEGDYLLSQTLTIPLGYSLIIEAGANIDLIENAAIVSYGSTTIKGTQNEVVTIYSSDSTGSVIIIGTDVNFNFVNFSKLTSSGKDNPLFYSGGVNIYESNITMNEVKFKDFKSEDALNVIRSKFNLTNISFTNIFSDALDSDFSVGEINTASFTLIGNDALDFSGSNVFLDNIQISYTGDKGISAGERSKVTGQNIQIEYSELALVSKDHSRLIIENAVVKNGAVGICAFQKTREYGPASINIVNGEFSNFKELYLLENKSTINHSGESYSPNCLKVVDELYGNKYGKSSK